MRASAPATLVPLDLSFLLKVHCTVPSGGHTQIWVVHVRGKLRVWCAGS